jgi:hypothetical protein
MSSLRPADEHHDGAAELVEAAGFVEAAELLEAGR